MRDLRDWTPGNSVRNNSHHQQAVDALRELQRRNSVPVAALGPRAVRLGVIVDEGPNGEDDYTDERYWVKLQIIEGATYSDRIQVTEDKSSLIPGRSYEGLENDTTEPNIVTVKNLIERNPVDATQPGCHLLSVGQTVRIEVWPDAGETITPHWVMTEDPGPLTVKVTGDAAGGRKYNGKVLRRPTEDILPTGNLANADIGEEGPDCLVVHPAEMGNGHDLADGIYIGRLLRVNEDGKPVVQVIGTGRVIVNVAADGGAGGDPDTDCTWTYQLKDKDTGDVLASGRSPKRRRHPRCEYLPASDNSPGLAYRDAGGTLQLFQAIEEIEAAKWVTVQLKEFPGDTRTAKVLVLERKIIPGANDYRCIHTFSCTFDCSEEEWFDVVHEGAACQIKLPPAELNTWIKDTSFGAGCRYLYRTDFGECEGADDVTSCTALPDYPAVPGFVPEECCPPDFLCTWAWTAEYDCEAEAWGPISAIQGPTCPTTPPAAVNEWIVNTAAGKCGAIYYVTGAECPGDENVTTCTEPPAAPAGPTERPTGCCEPEPEEEECTEVPIAWTFNCVDGEMTAEASETISIKNSALCGSGE